MGRGAPVCWILQQRLAKDCVLALAGWAEVLVTGRASCLCLANLILDGHTANACDAIQVDCACPWAQILLGKSCPCPKPQLSTTVFLCLTAGKPGHNKSPVQEVGTHSQTIILTLLSRLWDPLLHAWPDFPGTSSLCAGLCLPMSSIPGQGTFLQAHRLTWHSGANSALGLAHTISP